MREALARPDLKVAMINAKRIAISATLLHLQAVAIPILKDLGMSNLFSFPIMFFFSPGRIARFMLNCQDRLSIGGIYQRWPNIYN
jgi:hypothetical protein